MKKILFSILGAFMVSTMASAQYLNVKLKDGTYHSYKTSSDMEVSFGDKKGTDPTVSTQSVTVNGHKVTVKLADDILASDVAFSTNIDGDAVKVKAVSVGGYGLECIKDNEVLAPAVANGFHTFTVSNISKDMVVTIVYITVSFDLNNSNITDNFKAKPADITKIGYNSTVPLTYASAEKHSFRGWYTDKACTEAWDYSTRVTKSMTLYAKWAEDPAEAKINNHDYVKLGGYYWATENVYKADDVDVKNDGDENYGSYYIQNESQKAATSWGGTWTLPSAAQWQVLIDYCDWTWKTDYVYNDKKMNGYLVKGRADTYESDHSIFLPAAGMSDDGNSDVSARGDYGYYWSADAERNLRFGNGGRGMVRSYYPNDGMSVRPVLAE